MTHRDVDDDSRSEKYEAPRHVALVSARFLLDGAAQFYDIVKSIERPIPGTNRVSSQIELIIAMTNAE